MSLEWTKCQFINFSSSKYLVLQTTITLWIIIGQSEDKKDAECADRWFYLFFFINIYWADWKYGNKFVINITLKIPCINMFFSMILKVTLLQISGRKEQFTYNGGYKCERACIECREEE